MGYDSVWTSEAWGADAISSASWILSQTSKIKVGTGICQMQARSPALMSTTSLTLQALSGGRFILGLGPSGPQVIEGFHGVPYTQPVARMREIKPDVPRILLTGYADKENAIKAINEVGLFQYIEKPWENEDLKLIIRNGLEKRVLLKRLEAKIDEVNKDTKFFLSVQKVRLLSTDMLMPPKNSKGKNKLYGLSKS